MSLSLSKQKEALVIYTSGFGLSQTFWGINEVKGPAGKKKSSEKKGPEGSFTLQLPQTIERESVILIFRGKDGNYLLPTFHTKFQELRRERIFDDLQGKEVTAYLQDKEFTGTLVSSDDGLILRDPSGVVTLVGDYKALSFSGVPVSPSSLPFLEGRVKGLSTLEEPVLESSYSFRNVSWKAFYHLILREDFSVFFLKGKAFVRNYTGIPYSGITLRLITGEPSRPYSPSYRAASAAPRAEYKRAARVESEDEGEVVSEASSGEYYSYDITGVQNLPDKSEKEVELFEVKEFSVDPFYDLFIPSYNSSESERPLNFGVEFQAPRPLTEGQVEVYQEKEDALLGIYHGKASITRKPKGSLVKLSLGRSMAVTASYQVTTLNLTEGRKRYEPEDDFRVTLKVTLKYTPTTKDSPVREPVVRVYYDKGVRFFKQQEVGGDVKAVLVPEVGKVRYDVGPIPPGKPSTFTVTFDLLGEEKSVRKAAEIEDARRSLSPSRGAPASPRQVRVSLGSPKKAGKGKKG